jgi:hypothetical protein
VREASEVTTVVFLINVCMSDLVVDVRADDTVRDGRPSTWVHLSLVRESRQLSFKRTARGATTPLAS